MVDVNKMDCKLCFDELDVGQVRYKMGDEWFDMPYCKLCILELKANQWPEYVKALKTTDCKKTLKLLIEYGPPHNYRDLVVTENKEIDMLYYDDAEQSAKLDNSLDKDSIELLKKELLLVLDIIEEKQVDNIDANNIDYLGKIKEIMQKFNL